MGQINQMEPWLGVEEKNAVAAYLDSGAWLTEYERTKEFEQAVAAYVGSSHGVAMVNGTVTLFAALKAVGVGPGDEVVVPDYTMIATANAVVMAGATPRFVDVSPTTLCLDLERAEAAITPRTRAMMVVSLNGRSPNMEAATTLARRHGIHLIEDAAQALGSFHEGRHLGTFGLLGSFSFSVPKIITTGQGGLLVTDDEDIAKRLRQIKDFGRRRAGVDYHEVIGFNFKFTDLQAVIGLAQMKKLESRVIRKREMYGCYRERLAGVSEVQCLGIDLGETTPWFIDILVPDRDALQKSLAAKGIGSRPFYPAIHSQPAYNSGGSFPVSEDAAARGLWLPSSSFLTNEDIDRVTDAIREHYSAA